MNKLNFFRFSQYFMVIAVILEVYDALISPDHFHTLLFTGMAISSAIGFYLLKKQSKRIKVRSE